MNQNYQTRSSANGPPIFDRTDTFVNPFFLDVVTKGNKPDHSIRECPSSSLFKKTLLRLNYLSQEYTSTSLSRADKVLIFREKQSQLM